jgi:hypothetical protein
MVASDFLKLSDMRNYYLKVHIIMFDGEYREQELDINFILNPLKDFQQQYFLYDDQGNETDGLAESKQAVSLKVKNVLHSFGMRRNMNRQHELANTSDVMFTNILSSQHSKVGGPSVSISLTHSHDKDTEFSYYFPEHI